MRRVVYLLEQLIPHESQVEIFDMNGRRRSLSQVLEKARKETAWCSEVLPTPGVERVYLSRKGLFIREWGKTRQVLQIKCKRWKRYFGAQKKS